jgi:hypothetical protein
VPEPYATLVDARKCPPCDRFGEDDEETLTGHLRLATDVLYAMTGRQFTGPVTSTLRPCCGTWLGAQPDDWWGRTGYPVRPDIIAGEWYNLPAGPCGGCMCMAYECGVPIARLDLGVYPVTQVAAKIDGVEFSAFRIDANRYATRTDGGLWPTVQDLTKADTQPGTWSLTVTHGTPVPASLRSACARLACELTKHARGDDDCAIPLRVTTVSRQGSTYQLANVQELIDKGKTGIYEVDIIVGQLNPDGLRSRPRVASPDTIARRPRRM